MHRKIVWMIAVAALALTVPRCSRAQVYSPQITKVGQVDTSNMKSLVQGIYQQYHAKTDREKAEAIWRFYLTDGRFVKPGMFYHLLGYAYEEPKGKCSIPSSC